MGRGFKKRWQQIRELGQGGQGRVFLVRDKDAIPDGIDVNLRDGIRTIAMQVGGEEARGRAYQSLRAAVKAIVAGDDECGLGALKVLHAPEAARDAKNAEARISREIDAMSKVKHPNIVKILDCEAGDGWYVSQYHSGGTLAGTDRFSGDVPRALRAFRGLLRGVDELHKLGYVHRDVKPENIFLSGDDLILGDFGLVYFDDPQHTRFSETYENVGSRDWMPGWAYTMKIEDVKPTFDVFSLGKVLWSMVSGRKLLRLWYYDRDEFDVEQMFAGRKYIHFINPILEKCVVEDEDDCLSAASELLAEVDQALEVIENAGDRLDLTVKRKCKVCGIGTYELRVFPAATDAVVEFGLVPVGPRSFQIFSCDHCRHVQLFECADGKNPPAWNE